MAPRVAAAAPCVLEPSTTDVEGESSALLERARDLEQHGDLPRASAIRAFIATERPKDAHAREAGALALAGLARSEMPLCLEPVAALAGEIESKVCPPETPGPECEAISGVVDAAARLRAEGLVRRSDKEPGETARKLLLDAGASYEHLFTSRLKGPCERSEARCARADEVLFNAMRAYRAARDLDAAARVFELLANPRFGFRSELASKALLDEGNMYLATASYERAASRFERFAATAPRLEGAPAALKDAVVLRIGLGDLDRAREDADQFDKLYSATKGGDSVQIALALAHALAERGEAKEVIRLLESRMGRVQKSAPERIAEASMLLVRAYRATKRGREAKALAEKVAAMSPPREVGETESDMRATATKLTAIGEARLDVADEESRDALARALGKGDEKALAKRRRAVDDAERRYARVFDLGLPPPGPTVDAAAAIALLRSRLWAQALLAFGEARAEGAFRDALSAHRRCVDLSIKLEYRTDRVRACERWLERHDRARTKPKALLPPRMLRSDQIAQTPPADRTPPP